MGIVYLAVAQGDAGFTKLKVVKRLRSELASDPRAVTMFLDEARLAARLSHPNIVQTNEVGFDGRYPFLEMEYVEGQSLDALRRRASAAGAAIPIETSLWIVTQILAALDYAHELRDIDGTPLAIVHRDVSPHNVMLTYEGGVKLLDFGIAKAADSTLETQTGAIKGKATYMAPEQATGQALDRRADLFAVGILLWEVATGERFWGERNEFEIFLALRDYAPPPETASLPPRLAAICRRALARDPEDRYATAAAMLADIEAYVAEEKLAPGARALSKLVTELFADEREAVRAEVEAQLSGSAPGGLRSFVDAPVLRDAISARSAPTAKELPPAAIDETKLRQRTEIRGLRAIAGAAIAVAFAASLSMAVVAARGRRHAAAPPEADGGTAAGCASNRACREALGRPAVCRRDDGACAPLETDECKLFAEPGEADDDRTVFLGAMFPLSGALATEPIGRPSARAVDLARRDFVQIAHGLPQGDAPPRPVAVVACDDAADSAKVARHLALDVRVPAIIGFGSSKDFAALALSLFVPHRVLSIAAKNSSALITAIPVPAGEPRLVFRTSLSSAGVAEPVSLLVERVIEPKLRPKLRDPARPLRLALLRRRSAAGLALGDALFGALRFNGKSALENGAAFREVSIDEPSEADAGASYAAAVSELLRFAPDVVVYGGADELTAGLFQPLESAWPRAEDHRPTYVALNSFTGTSFSTWLGTNAELRHRFIGIAAPASTPANARFTMRYNEAYAEKVTANLSPAAPYDAFYLLAYAALAAGEGARRGSDLARAIERLTPPGKRIEVGPSAIFDAAAALRAGEKIDLAGAGGPLDFDLGTGESPADYVFVCPGVNARGFAENEAESGLGFASADRALHGALRCP